MMARVYGALTRLTGLSFTVVAPLLSTVLGGAAMVVMYRLMNRTAGRFTVTFSFRNRSWGRRSDRSRTHHWGHPGYL